MKSYMERSHSCHLMVQWTNLIPGLGEGVTTRWRLWDIPRDHRRRLSVPTLVSSVGRVNSTKVEVFRCCFDLEGNDEVLFVPQKFGKLYNYFHLYWNVTKELVKNLIICFSVKNVIFCVQGIRLMRDKNFQINGTQ